MPNNYYTALLNAVTGDKVTAARENNADQSVEDAFDLIPDLVDLLNSSSHFGTDTGSANNYIVARTNPAVSLAVNTQVVFLAQNANTMASVINLDGLGNKAILFPDFNSLEPNDITAGNYVWLIYDGTRFLLMATASGLLTRVEAQRILAQSAANAAQTSATNAGISETNSGISETNSGISETNSGISAAEALASENKAEEWAQNPFNDPVEPGEFSALHWATVSQSATFSFIDIESDSGTATATQNSDSMSIVGGSGISTAVVGKVLTITNTGSASDGWGITNTQSGNITSTIANDTFTINGAGGISSSGAGKVVTLTLDANVAFTNAAETISQNWTFSNGLSLPDAAVITLGTGFEFILTNDGSNNVINTLTGNLQLQQSSTNIVEVLPTGIDITGDVDITGSYLVNGVPITGNQILSTVVVSSPVTTIDFVSFDDNTKYIGYLLRYSNVTHDDTIGAYMQLQVLDSGSVDASNDFNTVRLEYDNLDNAGSPTITGTNVSNGNDLRMTVRIAELTSGVYGVASGVLYITGIGDVIRKVFQGTSDAQFNATTAATDSITNRTEYSGTWLDTNVNVDGFRLSLQGGDFRTGSSFVLYGVAK